MSMFLGPIHYWLYNKITIVEARRERYLQALENKYGKDFMAVADALEEEYGPKLDGQRLDQMVGNQPIHGFLSALIQKVEGGEGKLVKAAIDKYNGDAFTLLLETAEQHGREIGERAATEKDISQPSVEDVYRLLNDYLLEGMPCDQGPIPVSKSADAIELQHNSCLHRHNWEAVDAPMMEMCCFTNAWIGGFIQAVKPGMQYERIASIASGDPGCVAEYKAG